MNISDNKKHHDYDAIVVGAGHAGLEASYILTKMGKRVLICSVSLDNIAYLACNPSIGGTGKGHLVREVDALGGVMGILADKSALQIKMLNSSKGAAVHSLRVQSDRHKYHFDAKQLLEGIENMTLLQTEIVGLMLSENCVTGVSDCYGNTYHALTVILACGVYLDSDIITGTHKVNSGPNGFPNARGLSQNLQKLGIEIRRFATSTPPRILKKDIDFSKFSIAGGEDVIHTFSNLTSEKQRSEIVAKQKKFPCYLGYTNENTHNIIRENLEKSGRYSGTLDGVGPRYCPNIEDKIVRFSEKIRHQIFLEPEGETTDEYYIQGLFTGFAPSIQQKIVNSIEGLENAKLTRYAYAIEYTCVNSLEADNTLQSKKIKGLFFAGQILGSSGYEEAAALGLYAGINAGLYCELKSSFTLSRDESYIGVLVDDLIYKGVAEPYRMLTSRAENRLYLRQDNADIRLTEYAINLGIACGQRKKLYNKKVKDLKKADKLCDTILKPSPVLAQVLGVESDSKLEAISVRNALKRPDVDIFTLNKHFNIFKGISKATLYTLQSDIKYSGYIRIDSLTKGKQQKQKDIIIPQDLDYSKLINLRLEAREKLAKIRPQKISDAEKITGVNPADITVLLLYMKLQKQ